ncbi:microfibril-associated glycoprotein 4-like [Amphibalanus amphitrite]|uniref:microfibril-associated glycoprotein 4-like n=1 Tax=Amphibalanus amphitrite TaxID=1232801 RepID=UPI001C90FE81|nr:microfibril-associated glycoprotein 4-like [Amphibalanus amphitrite]
MASTVIGVTLVLWTALGGWTAAQQQQHQQQAALLSSTADDVFSIIARAVQQELRPVVRRLESRVESLDNRLTQLDSRVTELTTSILRSRQSEQIEELSSQLTGITARLDSQQSQLSELNTQLGEQKMAQSELSAKLDNLGNLTAHVDMLGSKLTAAVINTWSQQERVDDLAAKVNHLYLPRDCSDLPVDSPSGVYLLRPSGDIQQPPVEAYCDMDTAGGRWTVIQRRDDIQPRQDFYLGWTDYKEGFGNLTKEFWWGLEKTWQLTASYRQYELRVDLEAFDGHRRHATYERFRISSEGDGYKLSVSKYSGTAGDSLTHQSSMKFSTGDRDQDGGSAHCAESRQGAWWHDQCGWSSLNGRYRDGGTVDKTGIWWWTWSDDYDTLKKAEMKIRPT